MKSASFARKMTIIQGRVEASCHSHRATRLNCYQVKIRNGIEIYLMIRAFFESSPLRGIPLAELIEEASSQSVIDFRACGTAPLTAFGKSRAPAEGQGGFNHSAGLSPEDQPNPADSPTGMSWSAPRIPLILANRQSVYPFFFYEMAAIACIYIYTSASFSASFSAPRFLRLSKP